MDSVTENFASGFTIQIETNIYTDIDSRVSQPTPMKSHPYFCGKGIQETIIFDNFFKILCDIVNNILSKVNFKDVSIALQTEEPSVNIVKNVFRL